MFSRATSVFAVLAIVATVSACSDVTSPTSVAAPASARFSGSGIDNTPGGGGGGGGGGGQVATACGTLSVQTYYVSVYTTRTGIGFYGSATNCGSARESFAVDVVDDNTNPACSVNVPRFIAARNTAPGLATPWSAASTLVNCPRTIHTFSLTLRDTQTNTVLATTTASAFL